MNPRSVAVLGASTRSHAVGNTVIANLRRIGFAGPVYPVHPTAESVLDLPCYPRVSDIPGEVDCAVIALSADKVLPALRELAEIGTRSAVVFASGFAETGEAGARLQEEITAFCKSSGIQLCGPNCLGIHSVSNRVSLYSAPASDNISAGKLAVVSQSGSACIVLSSLSRLGFSHLVSLGNGPVTGIADYLDYLADDEHTKVAALFIETLSDPAAFARAVHRFRGAGKSIVALKVGRSQSGAAASAAHTGAIATSDVALEAFFRRVGVILVEDYDELTEVATLMLAIGEPASGGGVGVLNVSGGELALTCDIAERVGVRLPELTSATIERLRGILPAFGTPRNPVDATGSGVFDTQLYGDCLTALAEDPNIHIVAVSQDCPSSLDEQSAALYGRLAAEVAKRSASIRKPIVFFNNVSDNVHPSVLQPLQKAGIPALHGMRNALKAIRHFVDHSSAGSEEVAQANVDLQLRREKWVERFAQSQPLTERESKTFLRDHGVSVTSDTIAADENEAVAAARAIGYPVVLKIESPDIPHKTEVGGVVLNVRSDEECIAAHRKIVDRVRSAAPAAHIVGVLVQPMISGGVEAILGIATHEPFGPGVLVGCGGILVELVKDASFELAPISAELAAKMIDGTRLNKLLSGFRGGAAADRSALEALVVQLSLIAQAYSNEIDAIDLNPVAVLTRGSGVIVLDALVIQRARG